MNIFFWTSPRCLSGVVALCALVLTRATGALAKSLSATNTYVGTFVDNGNATTDATLDTPIAPPCDFTYTSSGSTAQITGCSGVVDPVLVIPDILDNLSVTSIESSVFQSKALTRVIIPDSVTSIGANAFQSNDLTNITFIGDRPLIDANAFTFTTLLCTPLLGFDGTDIIDYSIDDVNDVQASAQVSVTVQAYEIVTVNNTSKGGGIGTLLIGLIALVWLRLRCTHQQAKGILTKAMALMLCITLAACTSPDDDAPVVVVAKEASAVPSSANIPALVVTDTLNAPPQNNEVSKSTLLPLPESTLAVTTLPLETKEVASTTLTAPSASADDSPVFDVTADDTVTEAVIANVAASVKRTETKLEAETAGVAEADPLTDNVIDTTKPVTKEPLTVEG